MKKVKGIKKKKKKIRIVKMANADEEDERKPKTEIIEAKNIGPGLEKQAQI